MDVDGAMDPPAEPELCKGCNGDGWLNLNGLRRRHGACGGTGLITKRQEAEDSADIKAQIQEDERRGK